MIWLVGGFLNSYDYPGIGLHDELGLLVKAGLTPLQHSANHTIWDCSLSASM